MSEVVGQASAKQNESNPCNRDAISDPLERMLKANVRKASPGQFLIMEADEADYIICLLSGWLSLSKSLPDGEVQIVDFALPGEIIETGAAKGSVSAVNVEALTDVRVAVIPLSAWDEMKRQRPDLTRVSRHIRLAAHARMAERMLRLGRGKAKRRVAYALLELNIRLEAIGQAKEGKFYIPINQRVLGDFVGLTSVHVCRTLGQLAGDGIIKVRGQMNVEILEVDWLAEMAGVDLQILKCMLFAELNCMSTALACPAYA